MANLVFQLDEHIDHAVARGLRQAGLRFVTSAEAGRIGTADSVQLAHALAAERVMVTHDRDFTRLHRDGLPHCGITYCAQRHRSIGEIIAALVLLDEVYDPYGMRDRLEYI